MASELASIIVIIGTMLIFLFIAFALKESIWIKRMFLMLSLLMVPVLLFVGHLVADINGLASLSSILERIYGALVIVYVFLAALFIIKFIIFMFNMYSIKKQRGVDQDVDEI